ncbi:MAG TPA: hypothetical protein VFU19_01155 [Iamia sp.]|nr:hypothetical protein [Iamia sp.]
MDPDDLTRALEAWADATDPAADPVTAAHVAAADATAEPIRVRPRRWLAAAAVLVVALGIGGALAVTGDDGSPEVLTDGTDEPAGPRTQVVVIADIDDGDAPRTHRFTIESTCTDPCIPEERLATGPLLPGTSLVADLPLPTGAWSLRYESDTCGDPCGPLDETGALALGGDHPLSCLAGLPAGARRVVVRVTDHAGDGPPTCALDTGGAEPELTVPPAWTVRDPRPWSCGTGAWDIGSGTAPSDPDELRTTLTCFAEAVETGAPVEVPAGAALWRVGATGPDDRPVEILTGPDGPEPWTRSWCHAPDVGPIDHRAVDAAEPGGSGVTTEIGVWDEALFLDCTEAEALPLDLPPLDEAMPAPPTGPAVTVSTTTPVGGHAVDIVIDADDLPVWVEGVERRWVLTIAGGEVLAEGLVEEPGSPPEDMGGPPAGTEGTAAVAVVARGVGVPAGTAMLLTLEEHDCFSGGCSGARALPGDITPPEADPAPASTCASEVPPADQATAIVLTLREETCSAALADALPRLTVPLAWSLRAPAVEWCAGYPDDLADLRLEDIQRARAQCLLQALATDAAVVEMPGFGPEGDQTLHVEGIRSEGPRTVTLFSPPGRHGGRWAIEVCSSLTGAPDPPYIDLGGCTEEDTGL